MNPRPLRELFEAALALPAAQRDEFLDAHCTGPEERARLQRMLADAASPTSEAMPMTSAEALAAAIGEVERLPPGSHVGPFELLGLLGEGGYATVFRAVRETEGVRQEVALKLLHGGAYTSRAQRRFRRELQALAQLRHPSIAGLIEGGVTDSGQAYIALELVEGVSITRYARERRLDLRARLALFLQVCRAVEAAHRALIVHRDLKPSNVLVTESGRVQLIDFGVAKLIDADDATRTLAPGFTPAYAAPEQQRGEAITTATDVYALGVLLGELVTGIRLNDSTGRTPSSRIAEDTEPGVLPAPPWQSRKLLRGDLDNIVLRAIEADPERRYASAGALADDIEAHLEGQPVKAHPPSRLYRARKFVARHRGSMLGTLVFLLAVFAALGVALWQARVARSQAQRAGEVQHFVEAMFEPLEAGNNNSAAPSLHEVLQRALERLERAPPDDARVRADLLGMFARINDGVGEVESNLALAESAAQAAVLAYGEDDPRSLQARLLHGIVLRKNRQLQRAMEELESVRVAMQRSGVGGLAYAQVLDAQFNAKVMAGRIDPAEAVALKRESLRLRESDPLSTPDDIGSGYNGLGSALEGTRDYSGARVAYQRAFELRHAFLGDSIGAALSRANVGNTLSWTGEWRESLRIFEEARQIYARANVGRNAYLAGLLIRMCDLRVRLENLDAAEVDCAESVEMNRAVFGATNAEYASALVRDSARALAAGDEAVARGRVEEARAIYAAAGNAESQLRTLDIVDAARLRAIGQTAALRDSLLAVAAVPRYAEHWSAPTIFAWLAWACDAAPITACGESRRADAERILATPRFAHEPLRLPARTALARIDLRHGDRAKAAAELRRELDAAAAELGPDHSWRAEALLVLADLEGDGEQATRARDEAGRIIATLPAGHALRRIATPKAD